MKILLYITSHQQLEEYNYFAQFIKRLQINNICDIFIYCNCPSINSKLVTYYQSFTQTNKRLFITNLNAGYRVGGVEAISEGFDMGIFQEYDYVIHLHPDVYLTDDKYLMEILNENLNNDTVFFITKSCTNDDKFFSFDFFIFKPKLLHENIFKKELYTFSNSPENYLCDMIYKYEIKHCFIKRFENNSWFPRRIDENLKLYHEHDLEKVRNILQYVFTSNDVSTSKCIPKFTLYEL